MARRAVVIGAGFGGLAAAVRLRARGFEVVLLERLDQPGGRARVFRQDGFTFDAGPTVITAPYLLEELFQLVGRDYRDYFELVPIDPFYRILFHDGSAFDYVADEERLLAQIETFNPGDVDGYRRLAEQTRRIFDIGYAQLADKPFHDLATMLRVVPSMLKLQSYRSVHSMVASYISDDRLRQAFSFEPLLVGGNPFATSSIYLLIHWLERKWGVHFAMGGTTSIISGLTTLLAELGVDIRYNTRAEEILVQGGKVSGVRTESGVIACDIVVSNADPTSTYRHLIKQQHRPSFSDSKLNNKRQSMSLFVAYCGANRTWPNTAHHTIVMGRRYKELLRDIFDRRVLSDDFSLYVHAPTRTDASLAPPGHESFYVLSPVPNNRSGIQWTESLRAEYLERILGELDRRLFPGVSGSVVSTRTLTPQEFESDLESPDGSAFSLEPLLTQSAWFRYHNKSDDVGGLFFVGAGTHPGGGVPGVLQSARVLDNLLPEWEQASGKIGSMAASSAATATHRR